MQVQQVEYMECKSKKVNSQAYLIQKTKLLCSTKCVPYFWF